jgi:hypothetical protein
MGGRSAGSARTAGGLARGGAPINSRGLDVWHHGPVEGKIRHQTVPERLPTALDPATPSPPTHCPRGSPDRGDNQTLAHPDPTLRTPLTRPFQTAPTVPLRQLLPASASAPPPQPPPGLPSAP